MDKQDRLESCLLLVIREIVKLEQEIIFECQDEMKKVQDLSLVLQDRVKMKKNYEEMIKSVEDNMVALKSIKERLKIFYDIFGFLEEIDNKKGE